MGKPYIALQIFPCLIVTPVRDHGPHLHEDLRPAFGMLKKIRFKTTKSGNSTHKHTPQPKMQSASPLRSATLLLPYQYIPLAPF